MKKADLIKRLLEVTEQLHALETEVVSLEIRRQEQEFMVKTRESALLADESGVITGRNAETRAAQLWGMTQSEKVLVLDLEAQVMRGKADLNHLRTLHKSLLAISALLSPSSLQ